MSAEVRFVNKYLVSNVIIRGAEISKENLAKALSECDINGWQKAIDEVNRCAKASFVVDNADYILEYYSNMLISVADKFVIESAENFFFDEYPEKFVVGVEFAIDFKDRGLTKMPEQNDHVIRGIIKNYTGLCPDNLNTFVRCVSDNNF